MRNNIVTALTIGVFGGFILILQNYVNHEFIHPKNHNGIAFFEYAFTVLTAYIVIQFNDPKAGILKLFIAGSLCSLTVFGLILLHGWSPRTTLASYNFYNMGISLMVILAANGILALIISQINLKAKIKTNPEVLDDLDY